jgi:hypothetical protein
MANSRIEEFDSENEQTILDQVCVCKSARGKAEGFHDEVQKRQS